MEMTAARLLLEQPGREWTLQKGARALITAASVIETSSSATTLVANVHLAGYGRWHHLADARANLLGDLLRHHHAVVHLALLFHRLIFADVVVGGPLLRHADRVRHFTCRHLVNRLR